MKRESLILYGICLVLALVFLGFAAMNVVTAPSFSSFLTIDNLFATTFCLLMALVFLSVLLLGLMDSGVIPNPFGSSSTEKATTTGKAALPASSSGARLTAGAPQASVTGEVVPAREVSKDAKGRAVPPDVQRMMSEMNKTQQKTS